MASVECGTGEGLDGQEQEPSVDLVFKMLYILGFWPDEEANPTIKTYSRYFGSRLARLLACSRVLRGALQFTRSFMPWNLLIFSALHILIVHPVDIYLSWGNKLDMLDNIVPILAYNVVFITMASVFIQKDKFKVTFHQYETIYKANMIKEGEVQNTLARTRKLCNNVTRVFVVTSVGIALALILGTGGYYLPNRKFIVRGWYPYNKFASPAFEITLVVWVFEVIWLLFVGNMFLSVAVTTLVPINAYFTILLYQLTNIYITSTGNIISRMKEIESTRLLAINYRRPARHISNLPVLVSDNIPGCVDSDIYLQRQHNLAVVSSRNLVVQEDDVVYKSCPQIDVHRNYQDTKPKPYYGQVPKKMTEIAEDQEKKANKGQINLDKDFKITSMQMEQEMYIGLVDSVKLHVQLSRINTCWASFWEVLYASLYISNTVMFAVLVVMCATIEQPHLREFLAMFVWLQILGLYFLLNILMEKVTTQAAAVSEAIYACDWLESSPRFKRTMLMMMTRANQPLVVKCRGIDPLSLKHFAEMANTAYKMMSQTRNMVAK